jgi:hypothetical protein
VCLDHVHIGARQAGVGKSSPNHPLLRRPVGRGQAVRRTVGVDRAPAQHGKNTVTVAAGIGKPLQQQHSDTLAPAGAVRRGRERLAPAVGGQPTLPGELHEARGCGHHRDPTRQREVALSRAQGSHGEVRGDQRRGTGGVERDGGTDQPELVGDPPGDDARGVAGDEETLGGLAGLGHQQQWVILPVAADEHPGAAAVQLLSVDAAPLDGLPRGL